MQRPTLTIPEDQLVLMPARTGIHVLRQRGDEMFLVSSFCKFDDAVSYAHSLSMRDKEADCHHVYAEWAKGIVMTAWPVDLDELAEEGD